MPGLPRHSRERGLPVRIKAGRRGQPVRVDDVLQSNRHTKQHLARQAVAALSLEVASAGESAIGIDGFPGAYRWLGRVNSVEERLHQLHR